MAAEPRVSSCPSRAAVEALEDSSIGRNEERRGNDRVDDQGRYVSEGPETRPGRTGICALVGAGGARFTEFRAVEGGGRTRTDRRQGIYRPFVQRIHYDRNHWIRLMNVDEPPGLSPIRAFVDSSPYLG